MDNLFIRLLHGMLKLIGALTMSALGRCYVQLTWIGLIYSKLYDLYVSLH